MVEKGFFSAANRSGVASPIPRSRLLLTVCFLSALIFLICPETFCELGSLMWACISPCCPFLRQWRAFDVILPGPIREVVSGCC